MKDVDRARNIKLILSDVDGVLTDGGILFDNEGVEQKQSHIRDGLGSGVVGSLALSLAARRTL
jgi:3-deoxy-D-manno-octulosonate 8-phosphate phosphatase (KDO 8-P phosphatase)